MYQGNVLSKKTVATLLRDEQAPARNTSAVASLSNCRPQRQARSAACISMRCPRGSKAIPPIATPFAIQLFSSAECL
jgi:hypothetical protein